MTATSQANGLSIFPVTCCGPDCTHLHVTPHGAQLLWRTSLRVAGNYCVIIFVDTMIDLGGLMRGPYTERACFEF